MPDHHRRGRETLIHTMRLGPIGRAWCSQSRENSHKPEGSWGEATGSKKEGCQGLSLQSADNPFVVLAKKETEGRGGVIQEGWAPSGSVGLASISLADSLLDLEMAWNCWLRNSPYRAHTPGRSPKPLEQDGWLRSG